MLFRSFKASTFATAFIETIQKLHGNLKIVVSDRDTIFTGNIWTKLFSYLGTQLAHSSSYHPQSHGQTEIVNKYLEGYLCCFVSDKQAQWVKWLPLAEWWYNTSFHTPTKMTPFMALYGPLFQNATSGKVSHSYSIVDDLVQSPASISMLELL